MDNANETEVQTTEEIAIEGPPLPTKKPFTPPVLFELGNMAEITKGGLPAGSIDFISFTGFTTPIS